MSRPLSKTAIYAPSSILSALPHHRGNFSPGLSYLALREISVEAGELCLNGRKLYLRGVLDQGCFPGGWYAPRTDEDIRVDVELTLAMGFNCARKHQTAEDPR